MMTDGSGDAYRLSMEAKTCILCYANLTVLAVEIHVTFSGADGRSTQIYQQIRAAILDGRLRSGDPLPPSRELAERLQIARNTVLVAYDRLAGEGFVTGKVGAGTFVDGALSPGREDRPGVGAGVGVLCARAIWDTPWDPPDLSAEQPRFDFRPGLPDARLFPYESWRRLMSRELRPSAVGTGHHGDPAGYAGLRAAIARHVGVSRGVRADAADIVITNGIQQAIDLIGRVLLDQGACAAVENPGYPPPRLLLKSLGARIVPVPVDDEGLVVDALPGDARLVYVSPSHQFPLGMAMSLRRRMALLAWAAQRGVAIVEDDYDSEFRFAGHPIEPLHSLDRDGRVIYVGSFSKSMLPTLRLGFLVTPPSLRRALRTAKFLSDWHTSLPTQAALARFIDEGRLARHVRRMQALYQARYRRIRDVLSRDFAGLLEPIPSSAGLHLSAIFEAGTAEDMLNALQRAHSVGVSVCPLSDFTVGQAQPGLVIGYGAILPERIDEGLHRLKACLAQQC
jgi:GntR family transcriptional regulator/MocR family aminotransferase